MRRYTLTNFGLANLKLESVEPPPLLPGHVRVDMRALSLNYRDLLVMEGHYNAKLRLPITPISDGAGVVLEAAPDVRDFCPGDPVLSVFVPDWLGGQYRMEYLRSTLGTPGPGWAAEQVVLPTAALMKMPDALDFAAAATLPIAAVTAWSALHAGGFHGGTTVLTLGTGGVAIFTLQLAKALGARVLITSSSDEKLAHARQLGADVTINYRATPDWDAQVLKQTGGLGADLIVETAGAATLGQSLNACRASGTIALLGALGNMLGQLNTGPLIMKQIRLIGIMVGSRMAAEDVLAFVVRQRIKPVIDRRFAFDELPQALAAMKSAAHFGKIVVERK